MTYQGPANGQIRFVTLLATALIAGGVSGGAIYVLFSHTINSQAKAAARFNCNRSNVATANTILSREAVREGFEAAVATIPPKAPLARRLAELAPVIISVLPRIQCDDLFTDRGATVPRLPRCPAAIHRRSYCPPKD